jgi:hypothetical protein
MRRASGQTGKLLTNALRSGTELLLACLALLFLFNFSHSQTIYDLEDPAPPPLRKLSPGEKEQLDAHKEPKRRVETSLQLMSGRIKKAEELKTAENYDAMFLELGGFHGLMDNTIDFLKKENQRTGKAFNYFKKYELGLRSFTPRLELIRRDIPTKYDPYIMRLLRYLRDARTKAIEPFFGDSVLPDKP